MSDIIILEKLKKKFKVIYVAIIKNLKPEIEHLLLCSDVFTPFNDFRSYIHLQIMKTFFRLKQYA